VTPPRIDAHQHYWSIDHCDYDWLRPTPQLAAIYKNFAPADLHPLLDAAAIDATVLVQAAPSEAETWRLLDLAALPGSRVAGVVGWCDLLAPDVDERVRRLAAQPLLKGLRPMLQDIDDARWILQPTLQPAFAAMRRHGLAFDALVKGAAQLDTLVGFAQQQSELPIVLDHAGKPPIADGRLQHWITAIRRIARTTSVHCKLSGLITEAGADWSLDRLRPCVDLLLSEFGPQRLIWGSDWPVLNLAGSYAPGAKPATRCCAG
jgi:L-fuconolactonase